MPIAAPAPAAPVPLVIQEAHQGMVTPVPIVVQESHQALAPAQPLVNPRIPAEDLAPTKTSPRLSSSHISESSVTPSETRDIQRHAGQKAPDAAGTQTPAQRHAEEHKERAPTRREPGPSLPADRPLTRAVRSFVRSAGRPGLENGRPGRGVDVP